MSEGTGIGVVILDVVVMDVSRVDVTVMGSDSINCGGMGNLGVRVEGGHDGRMVETMTVDEDERCMLRRKHAWNEVSRG